MTFLFIKGDVGCASIIISNVVDSSLQFVPPPEEAFERSLNGKPIRIVDPKTNRTSALVKLNNFIDTYLYIVKFLDPKSIVDCCSHAITKQRLRLLAALKNHVGQDLGT